MKMMKVLVAMLVLVGMVAPAIAEDRLSLSGEMRVRGWHTDYDGDDFTSTWGDQRLRVGGKIAVAEGVSITFRTDITESNWGTGNTFGSGRTGVQQWDRAHLDIAKGNFHLRAGQQYVAYGSTYAFDTQDNGLSFDVKGPVPVHVFALQDRENAPSADSFVFGAKVSPKLSDALKTEFFVAGQTKAANNDEEVYLIGANLAAMLGAVNLVGEVDFFTGDAANNVDAMGTQLFVDASLKATEMATVGGQLYYALARDNDEVQYQSIGNQFGGWDPIMDVGTLLSNEQITLGKPFDFTGQGAGVVGGRLYVNSKLSDAFNVGASFAYLTAEDDDIADVDEMAFAAGMTYAVMANTSLQAQLQYTDGEENNNDFDAVEAGVGLFVAF